MAFKIDIHNHILPERWPDLKEVSTYFAANFGGTFDSELSPRTNQTKLNKQTEISNALEQPRFREL